MSPFAPITPSWPRPFGHALLALRHWPRAIGTSEHHMVLEGICHARMVGLPSGLGGLPARMRGIFLVQRARAASTGKGRFNGQGPLEWARAASTGEGRNTAGIPYVDRRVHGGASRPSRRRHLLGHRRRGQPPHVSSGKAGCSWAGSSDCLRSRSACAAQTVKRVGEGDGGSIGRSQGRRQRARRRKLGPRASARVGGKANDCRGAEAEHRLPALPPAVACRRSLPCPRRVRVRTLH